MSSAWRTDFSKAGPREWLKAAAYAVNGVKPVEFNPNFLEEMKERTGGKGVILVRAVTRTSASCAHTPASRPPPRRPLRTGDCMPHPRSLA